MSRHGVRNGTDATSEQKASRLTHGRVTARLVTLAIGLSLAATSCSNDRSEVRVPIGQASSRTTTSTSSRELTMPTTKDSGVASATLTPNRSVEDEIVARYLGFWRARFAANRGVPNPDDPALRAFATGAQLEMVITETRANLQRGLAFRRTAKPSGIERVHVIELDGDHAVVQECVVADGLIVRNDTGAIVNGDIATHNVRGDLVRVDGVWKVSSTRLVQRWEGVAGCALAQ